MKKILLILLLIIGILQAKEEKSLMWMIHHPDISANKTTIDGKRTFQMDFDEDGIIDNVILDSNEIKITSQKGVWKIEYVADSGVPIYKLVKIKNKIYFLQEGTGTSFFDGAIYLYDKKTNNWFNIAEFVVPRSESNIDIFTEQLSVDGTIIKIKDKDSLLQITSNNFKY